MARQQVSRVCLFPHTTTVCRHALTMHSPFFSRDCRRDHWPATRSGVKASRAIEHTKKRTQRCPSSPLSDVTGRVDPPSACHYSHKMPSLQAELRKTVHEWPSRQRHSRGHHCLAWTVGTIELEGSDIAGSRAHFLANSSHIFAKVTLLAA